MTTAAATDAASVGAGGRDGDVFGDCAAAPAAALAPDTLELAGTIPRDHVMATCRMWWPNAVGV